MRRGGGLRDPRILSIEAKAHRLSGNGVGDVVMACWVLCSAKSAGHVVHLDPRDQACVPKLLAIDQHQLTSTSGRSWTSTVGIGTQHEYESAPRTSATRSDLWCDSLQLPRLSPVRPDYAERPCDGAWADEQWGRIDPRRSLRAVLFPAAAWPVRV